MFFGLANWRNSDITRFRHYLGVDPAAVLKAQLRVEAAPLICALPYRLAAVHGWGWVIAAVTGSALSHNSLPITATLALLPLLTRPQILQRHGRRKLALTGLLVLICTAFSLTQPAVMKKTEQLTV